MHHNNINTENKEEYKKFIKHYLPREISKNLIKKGGLIHESFFVNNETKSMFLTILNNKYKNIFTVPNTSSNLRQILYKMYVFLFNYFFIKNKSFEYTDTTTLDLLSLCRSMCV